MEIQQAALIQEGPFQDLMNNIFKLKQMLNKFIEQLDNITREAIQQHLKQFTKSQFIYKILEPQIQFDKLVQFMNKDQLFTQTIKSQTSQQSNIDFALLKNVERNINELKNKLKQEFLTVFQKIRAPAAYISDRSNVLRFSGGIVEKLKNAQRNKNYSFQIIRTNNQKAYLTILKGLYCIIGLACSQSLEQRGYEQNRSARLILYSISQTGFIGSMIKQIDGQECDFKFSEEDTIMIEYDKLNKKFKILNTMTRLEYQLDIMEKHITQDLVFVVGLKNEGDQFQLLPIPF